MKILVSACLLGDNCKYNGGNNLNEKLVELLKGHQVIKVCPEVMGGLPTPRNCCEIVKGVVLDAEGNSHDERYRRGAWMSVEIAKKSDVDFAIMQSRSPSCGVGKIYDGKFRGKLKKGFGITAEALQNAGFRVVDVEEAIKHWNQVIEDMKKPKKLN